MNAHAYWVKFANRAAACVEDESASAALAQAASYGDVIHLASLPYPAEPRISPKEKWVNCPAFCYDPEYCQGQKHCRKRPACTE